MLKKIFLIFVFLFIAQAIAYCLPGDTVWIKNKVFVGNLKFSVSGDSIFTVINKNISIFQIRSTATGNILREFLLDSIYPISEFKLSSNGRKIYFGMNYPMDHYIENYPLIVSLDLQTGDTTAIARSNQAVDTNSIEYYLWAYGATHLSISKDEKYLISDFSTKFGGGTLLFGIVNLV